MNCNITGAQFIVAVMKMPDVPNKAQCKNNFGNVIHYTCISVSLTVSSTESLINYLNK